MILKNKIKYAIDFSQLDEDQTEIYYAMLESASKFRLGIEQLEGTKASDFQIRELYTLHSQLEQVLAEAVPGKGGTASGKLLEVIDPIEDYIFNISASLKNINYYEVQDIQNALETMYLAIGSLKEMSTTYYPATETQIEEPQETTNEALEAEQILEQKEDEAKDIINSVIVSDAPKEDKKREIDNTLNEVGYAAVYSTLKKLKSHGYTDLAVNEEAKNLCYQEVLDSFLEIVNESALNKYLNRETLEADAKYVADYFFNILVNTTIEWK